MKNFARIQNGLVVNIEAATDEWVAEQNDEFLFVEPTPGVSIGAQWNGTKFVLVQPFASWTLDANNDWQPPTPKPEGNYYWNEESLSWLAIPVG